MSLHKPVDLFLKLRNVFNLDYELTRSFMIPLAFICSFSYLAFHWIDQYQGFVDWLPIRVAAVLVPVPILFYPRQGRLRWHQVAYYEMAVFTCLPMIQTILSFHNPPSQYWVASNIFWAMLCGVVSKPVWLPFHVLAGPAAAIALHGRYFGPTDPERLQVFWGQQPLVWITAIVGAAVKVGLEVLHRRTQALAEAKARAAEAEKRESELKEANEELLRRETVIRRFVRPSLMLELNHGVDPVTFRPVERHLAILFCDIRDFTYLTEVLDARQKQEFLNRYFSMMTHPIIENKGEVDKIMGDCVMGVFPDGERAVKAAVEMRMALQDFNKTMIEAGQPKIRNGIGIAKGAVLAANFGSFEKLDRTVIGEAVNIASRLESKTKMYNLEVVVTEDVVLDLPQGSPHFRWIDMVKVKGSTRRVKLYEVYGHQPEEVRRYKDETRETLEKALAIYFTKDFKEASRLLHGLRENVPPHRHAEGQPMDSILNYYLAHCDAWLGDPNSWERIQNWDGVHVFFEK